MPPTLSYCPGLAPSIPQTGRLQSAHNNCQTPSVTVKECSGKVPGRGAGAGQAGSRGRGLRARRDPCSPALGLSSHSQAMPISHTCTQHTEALRYTISSPPEASAGERAQPTWGHAEAHGQGTCVVPVSAHYYVALSSFARLFARP